MDDLHDQHSRVLLVGELNPFGADPRLALYHMPRGSSGDRLRRILGLRDCEYARLLDKVNLCRGRWSEEVALEEAQQCLGSHHSVLVLLGSKVRSVFKGPLPFEWSVVRGKRLVGLPHPSGRCRVWNDSQSAARARAIMSELVGGVPWGTATDRIAAG